MTVVILDTDIVTHLLEGTPAGHKACDEIEASGQPFFITDVTVQELLGGRVEYCRKARTNEDFANGLRKLMKTYRDLQPFRVIEHDASSLALLRMLKAARIRIGANDLRIASIVRTHDAEIYTLNLSDFRQVPDLKLFRRSPRR